ncbi:MAG: patatin-like phospholipase family protein [Pseudomonadota bacterium]
MRINLALQGGGAHGSFTWGVLDRLLEEPELDIAAITGTSAGALNGAALKAGMIKGGREAARDNLAWLWEQIGAVDDDNLAPWLDLFSAGALSKSIEYSLPYIVADTTSRMMSPYCFGSIYRNPLTRIVDQFAYDAICDTSGPELFVCATNVRSGKIRVFSGAELSTDTILASACLPTLFQAVEIDDPKTGKREAYWDGGYTGNPALFPLFAPQLPDDVVIVNINPIERDALPQTPQDIQNRINEISFNSSLLRELRAISFVDRLIREGRMPSDAMRSIKVHMIADDALMNELSVATKIVPTPIVLSKLKAAGRAAAEAFLSGDAQHVGQRSSVDLHQMFG